MTLLATPPRPVVPQQIVESVESVVGVWGVAYVKSRQEKAFAEDLSEAGIPNYLPLTRRIVNRDRHREVIEEPTFRGYCFFAARGAKADDENANDLYAVKGSSRVVTLLDIRDQKLFVKELAQIQRALEINPGLGACLYLTPGAKVRVTKGPMIGMEGILESNTKNVFHIRLSMMQSSIEVTFPDESYLEVV